MSDFTVILMMAGAFAVTLAIRFSKEIKGQRKIQQTKSYPNRESKQSAVTPTLSSTTQPSSKQSPQPINEIELGTRYGNINVAVKGLMHQPIDVISEVKWNCKYGTPVRLQREPDNEQDPHAVAVLLENDMKIGYVPREYAKSLSNCIKEGYEMRCRLSKVTRHEIPFVYMDIAYRSPKFIAESEERGRKLIEKLKRIGLDDYQKIRRGAYWKDKNKRYGKTVDISAVYNYELQTYEITEQIENNKGEIVEISYYYADDIGRHSFEIGQLLEKEENYGEAIQRYEFNLSIGEVMYKSSNRLSVLYKKVGRHADILPMLYKAKETCSEWQDNHEKMRITERIRFFETNENFMKKYAKK